MLTEDGKAYYEKRIKQNRILSKTFLIFLIIPSGILIYFFKTYKEDDLSLLTLIFIIITFFVAYTEFVSCKIQANILTDIINNSK